METHHMHLPRHMRIDHSRHESAVWIAQCERAIFTDIQFYAFRRFWISSNPHRVAFDTRDLG